MSVVEQATTAAPGAPSAVEILEATLSELRNEPRFVVENRTERRARLKKQRRQTK